MFKQICDNHAQFKRIKIRSKSDLWITNEIRRKVNYRYKLFKSAASTKDETAWASHKKIRNEITADVGRAKATFFRKNIDAAKSTAAYWKVLSDATNRKRRLQIGPLKRGDNTLAVRDEEKANLINTFFATVRTSLSRNSICAPVEA